MSTKLNYFDVDEATLFGVNGSVILNHIRSWIFKNKTSNRNFHDGHYWTYNSISGFKQYYPYFSEKQISTILIKTYFIVNSLRIKFKWVVAFFVKFNPSRFQCAGIRL